MGELLDNQKIKLDERRNYSKIKTPKKARKDNKMSEQKTAVPKKPKYSKTRGEHLKDLLIAILISGIVAFVIGIRYANAQNATVQKAVEAVETVEPATPVKK